MRFVKHDSLTLALGTGFLLTLAGQAVSGHADFNNQLVTDGHKAGVESDAEQKVGDHAGPASPRWAADTGWRQKLYSRSLGTVGRHLRVVVAGPVHHRRRRLQRATPAPAPGTRL
ncbi:DUF6766 family protein, partial [Streptomyces sp. NPDC001177]